MTEIADQYGYILPETRRVYGRRLFSAARRAPTLQQIIDALDAALAFGTTIPLDNLR